MIYRLSVIPDQVCRGRGLAVAAELVVDQVLLVQERVTRHTLLVDGYLGVHHHVLVTIDHHAVFVDHVELVVDAVFDGLRPHLQVHRLSLGVTVHELLLLVLQFELLLTLVLLLEQAVRHLPVTRRGLVVLQFDHLGRGLSRDTLLELEGLVGLTVDIGLGLFMDVVDGQVVLDDIHLAIHGLLRRVNVVLLALLYVLSE